MKNLLLLVVITVAQAAFAGQLVTNKHNWQVAYKDDSFALDDSYVYHAEEVIFRPGSQAGYRQVELLDDRRQANGI